MDIMLSNIVYLIGNKRGAKKELADFLGISQNIFTSWFAQKSESYKKYAPRIAEYYGVSLDWLSGLTDVKGQKEKPVTKSDELTERQVKFLSIIEKLPPDKFDLVEDLAIKLQNIQ